VAMTDVARAEDPFDREVRSMMDVVWKRMPGFRGSLPIKRNMFGEPVEPTQNFAHNKFLLGEDSSIAPWVALANPISYSTVSDDVLDKEIAALGRGFAPPNAKRGGIELKLLTNEGSEQTAYDRWQQLQGEVELDGKTLREAMTEVIKEPGYQVLPLESDDDLDSPRIRVLRKLINKFRDSAYSQVLQEFPEARQQTIDRLKRKREMILGVNVGP